MSATSTATGLRSLTGMPARSGPDGRRWRRQGRPPRALRPLPSTSCVRGVQPPPAAVLAAQAAAYSGALTVAPDGRALRLTRRGRVVVVVACAAVAACLLWLAHTGSATAGPAAPPHGVVTVAPGDTLWSIAGRVAPQRDPRVVVAQLMRGNDLPTVAVTPGQILRVVE